MTLILSPVKNFANFRFSILRVNLFDPIKQGIRRIAEPSCRISLIVKAKSMIAVDLKIPGLISIAEKQFSCSYGDFMSGFLRKEESTGKTIFLKKQTELPDCIFLSDFNRLARCIAGYDFTIGQADYPGIGNEHF